jgi:hypothetical protein
MPETLGQHLKDVIVEYHVAKREPLSNTNTSTIDFVTEEKEVDPLIVVARKRESEATS